MTNPTASFNNTSIPAYLTVPINQEPSASAIQSLKEAIYGAGEHSCYTKLNSDIKENAQHSAEMMSIRFASLIRTIKALGENNPDFLANAISKRNLERVVEFMCLPQTIFGEQRLDFFRTLASIPFTDEQSAAIIKESIFSGGRWVYEPELMCAAHWLDKMAEEDRDTLLQFVPVVNSKFVTCSNSFNYKISQHLIVSGVLDTEGYQPEWAKTLLEQPLDKNRTHLAGVAEPSKP